MVSEFDIKKVNCNVKPADTDNTISDGIDDSDIQWDSFEISPEAEDSLIEGLKGEVGFNRDPSTAASATLSVKSTTDSGVLGKFEDIYYDNKIVKIEIVPEEGSGVGFTGAQIGTAKLISMPDMSFDDEEAVVLDFEFQGYGYEEYSG